MKKLRIFITCFFMGFGLIAQDEAMVIKSSAHVNFDGDVKLVLSDISLVNEGELDVTSGEIAVNSSSDSYISTNQSLSLNALSTAGNNITFNAEGAFDVQDLNIASTDELVFSDTSSLTLNGDFNAVGELTMESGAALWIKATITETAMDNVNVERIGPHNSGVGRYSVYGSPMTNSDFNVLGANAQNWMFEYDESTNGFTTPTESTMTVGKGYFVAFPGDSDGKITFSGIPRYKNLTYSVTRTDGSAPDEEEGFNLVANPFTCPVDFDTFISDTGNEAILEESTIWLWDDIASETGGSTVDDYLAVNYLGASSYDITDSRNGGSANWDGTINVAQGFFIKAQSAGSISFKQNMKTLDGNDDDSFYRTIPITRYWLSITNQMESANSSTLLGFLEEATFERDYLFDASRFGTGLGIYSLLEDKKLAIQGLPNTWMEIEQQYAYLPLGINVPEAGTYKISLKHQENNELSELYLIDHINESSVNILLETYEFTTSAGSINDRFSLSLRPFEGDEVLNATTFNTNIHLYGNPGKIVLDAQFDGNYRIYTFDGRLIQQNEFQAQKSNIPCTSGLYLVVIENEESVNTYKVKVD